MFLPKIFFVAGFLFMACVNCHATTVAEECQKRAMAAFDKGSTYDEKKMLGVMAANECFKEMEALLKENGDSSSSNSKAGGAISIVLLLAISGFFAYRFATRGEKAMSPSEITNLREQVRDLYRPDSFDLRPVRQFKEDRLNEAEKMFASALSGGLVITRNDIKGGILESRQELEEIKANENELIAQIQSALDAAIKVRDSVNKVFSTPPIDSNDKEEMELRESLKGHLAEAQSNVEKYQRKLTEIRSVA